MQSAQSIAELYAEHTQGNRPADELVAQLLLEPGETVVFACGWSDMSEKWALVVALADGTTPVWEHLTDHQIEPAAAAIEAALDGLD